MMVGYIPSPCQPAAHTGYARRIVKEEATTKRKGCTMTITQRESRRRYAENKRTFPHGGIDDHNDANKPCECCGRDQTRGDCFEDKDCAYICNYCYWTRTDRKLDLYPALSKTKGATQ